MRIIAAIIAALAAFLLSTSVQAQARLQCGANAIEIPAGRQADGGWAEYPYCKGIPQLPERPSVYPGGGGFTDPWQAGAFHHDQPIRLAAEAGAVGGIAAAQALGLDTNPYRAKPIVLPPDVAPPPGVSAKRECLIGHVLFCTWVVYAAPAQYWGPGRYTQMNDPNQCVGFPCAKQGRQVAPGSTTYVAFGPDGTRCVGESRRIYYNGRYKELPAIFTFRGPGLCEVGN